LRAFFSLYVVFFPHFSLGFELNSRLTHFGSTLQAISIFSNSSGFHTDLDESLFNPPNVVGNQCPQRLPFLSDPGVPLHYFCSIQVMCPPLSPVLRVYKPITSIPFLPVLFPVFLMFRDRINTGLPRHRAARGSDFRSI